MSNDIIVTCRLCHTQGSIGTMYTCHGALEELAKPYKVVRPIGQKLAKIVSVPVKHQDPLKLAHVSYECADENDCVRRRSLNAIHI